jgi:outer membrane protein assembly factor BamA
VLEVRLNEDYMRQLDSEIGWATLDCVRARLQYTDKNVFGKVRRLDLTGQVSKLGYGYPLASTTTRHMCTLGNSTDLRLDQFSDSLNYFTAATLRQPRLLGTRWVPTVSLFSERRSEFRAYLRSTPIGADFSATREIGERMPLRLGYTVEYGRTTAQPAAFCALFNLCDPDAIRPLNNLGTLGVASASLARIRTDNLINPGRGYTVRGELRTSASRALATDDTAFYFNKGTTDLAWYKRIDSRNVLAFRVRAGAVLGRRLRFNDPVALVPTQERLFAGGPTSVRGFQQNELGPLAYIADNFIDTTFTEPTPGDSIFHFQASDTVDLGRAVPLGGNSLVVTNFEYRFRDPFFFPNLLQYVLFVDGGNVWTRGQESRFVVTPGIGFRALTFVGPVQINVGYNGYQREAGALYFNPNFTTLLCVSPGNQVFYQRGPAQTFLPIDDTRCNNFDPPPRNRLLQRLTFTFSIGTDF